MKDCLVEKGKLLTVDFSRVTIQWSHRGHQCRRSLGSTRKPRWGTSKSQWKICPTRDLELCFLPVNDNATRQNDVASLARIVLADRRARPRYADKAEDSRKLSAGDRGRGAKRRTLTRAYRRDLTRDPERSSRRRTRGVSSKESGTQIDDPGAQFEKRGVPGESGRGGIHPGRKKSTEVEPIAFFLSRVRTCQCAWIRAYSRACYDV